MSRSTLRTQNVCRTCGYRWYPRGHAMSLRCPGCGSSDVRQSYKGLISLLGLVVFVIWAWWVRERDLAGDGHFEQAAVPSPVRPMGSTLVVRVPCDLYGYDDAGKSVKVRKSVPEESFAVGNGDDQSTELIDAGGRHLWIVNRCLARSR